MKNFKILAQLNLFWCCIEQKERYCPSIDQNFELSKYGDQAMRSGCSYECMLAIFHPSHLEQRDNIRKTKIITRMNPR